MSLLGWAEWAKDHSGPKGPLELHEIYFFSFLAFPSSEFLNSENAEPGDHCKKQEIYFFSLHTALEGKMKIINQKESRQNICQI